MTFALVDTSVWARRHQPDVAATLAAAIERDDVVTVAPLVLELLAEARAAAEYRELASDYGELIEIALDRRVTGRALGVQAALAGRGFHRGPSPTDLLAAAAAELAGAELWHCDRHFELIGGVTGQPMRRMGT